MGIRVGWSNKDAARVLEVAPTKVPQAMLPAIRKIAKLMRVDPHRTMDLIRAEMDDLEPMTDAEIQLREDMLMGRADRSDIHPK